MGVSNIDLNWDNTNVNASPNTTGQRASKREVLDGPNPWDTTGITPANDLPKTASYAQALIKNNHVYDFKIEALCVEGGPTINDNGVKQGIVFECVPEAFENEPGDNPGELVVRLVGFNVPATSEINKVKFELWDSLNTTLLDTSPEINNGPAMEHTFTGLAPGGSYYVRMVYGAMVDLVQVWSSFSGVSVGSITEVCYFGPLLASV